MLPYAPSPLSPLSPPLPLPAGAFSAAPCLSGPTAQTGDASGARCQDALSAPLPRPARGLRPEFVALLQRGLRCAVEAYQQGGLVPAPVQSLRRSLEQQGPGFSDEQVAGLGLARIEQRFNLELRLTLEVLLVPLGTVSYAAWRAMLDERCRALEQVVGELERRAGPLVTLALIRWALKRLLPPMG
jgi:hypothetical protein